MVYYVFFGYLPCFPFIRRPGRAILIHFPPISLHIAILRRGALQMGTPPSRPEFSNFFIKKVIILTISSLAGGSPGFGNFFIRKVIILTISSLAGGSPRFGNFFFLKVIILTIF